MWEVLAEEEDSGNILAGAREEQAMTSDTADKVAAYITLGFFGVGLLAIFTQPTEGHPFIGLVAFTAVVGVIVRVGLGLFVRKS